MSSWKMKTIRIKDKYEHQLKLLSKVSGKSSSQVINRVLIAGLAEVGIQVLKVVDSEECNNEK